MASASPLPDHVPTTHLKLRHCVAVIHLFICGLGLSKLGLDFLLGGAGAQVKGVGMEEAGLEPGCLSMYIHLSIYIYIYMYIYLYLSISIHLDIYIQTVDLGHMTARALDTGLTDQKTLNSPWK